MTSARPQDIALQDLDLEGQANPDARVNGHAVGNTSVGSDTAIVVREIENATD